MGWFWVLRDWGDFCGGVHKEGRAVLCCAGDLVIWGVHLPCGKVFVGVFLVGLWWIGGLLRKCGVHRGE